MYNAITRDLDKELIPACHRYGIDVVIYNPIAGGLFSGKIKSVDQLPDDELSRFGTKAHNGENYRSRYFRNATFEALEMVEGVASKHQLSLIEVALRWCVHHSALKMGPNGGHGDGIIIGVSSLAQLQSNLKDVEKGPLPEEVVDVLDQAWQHVKAVAPNYYRGKLEYGYDTQKALYGQT